MKFLDLVWEKLFCVIVAKYRKYLYKEISVGIKIACKRKLMFKISCSISIQTQ